MYYMLLIYDCDRPEPGDPRYEDAVVSLNKFTDEARRRGALVGGHALERVNKTKTVRVRDDQTLITDGPFVETHEHLGGYYILDCPTMEDALDLAALCPMAQQSTIEVRPIAIVADVDNSPAR